MPRSQTREELWWPIVDRFEDDLSTLAPNKNLGLVVKPAILGKPNSLAATVLKNLCPGGHDRKV